MVFKLLLKPGTYNVMYVHGFHTTLLYKNQCINIILCLNTLPAFGFELCLLQKLVQFDYGYISIQRSRQASSIYKREELQFPDSAVNVAFLFYFQLVWILLKQKPTVISTMDYTISVD